jgi:hypothetical protein
LHRNSKLKKKFSPFAPQRGNLPLQMPFDPIIFQIK